TLRTTHRLARNLVDLFDRVTIFKHGFDCHHRAKSANAIRDKVWPILRGYNTFAESLIQEAVEEAGHFRLGPLGANYFNEMKITRRVEKVDAEKVRLEIFGATFR